MSPVLNTAGEVERLRDALEFCKVFINALFQKEEALISEEWVEIVKTKIDEALR